MLTKARLRELLRYDPDTGVFTWLFDPGNQKRAGMRAGYMAPGGPGVIGIGGTNYLQHRLAWLYVYGCWPEKQVDHINGNEHDNRIANLREVTNAENCQNKRRAPSTNRHGTIGVSPIGRRWRAQIKTNGVKRHLGMFDTPEEAHEAWVRAKVAEQPGCKVWAAEREEIGRA